MAENILDILRKRDFVKQTVYEDELYTLLANERINFYIGFDPTADSLHIGHYIPIMAMAHMQRAGHKPIALIGGATAMIGDPSHRSDMRSMMTKEQIAHNCQKFAKQMSRFLSFEGPNAARLVNNADWLCSLNYIDFLRDYGAFLSVNKMLTAECFKTRLQKGLSFLEFNYMPMQAYDFLHLFKQYDCKLQMGGNDQWSNILAGADFIRRVERKDAFALTLSLLETSDGTKMGKTQKGALWLDADKTSPFEFYQYFRNVDDSSVETCFKLLTFVELDEISILTKHKDERINEAKKRLAYEVTALVHGKDAALKAHNEALSAFSGDTANMPSCTIKSPLDTPITDILVLCGACSSKSEGRRLIEGGGVKINENKVENVNQKLSEFTNSKEFVLHKGKKFHIKVLLD